MRRTVGVIALMLAVLSLAAWGESNDQFTPVVVSPLLHKTQRVLGTDGQDHVVYELTLTNTSHVTATLKKIEILDARDPSFALDAYEGETLLARLFMWDNKGYVRDTGNFSANGRPSKKVYFAGQKMGVFKPL